MPAGPGDNELLAPLVHHAPDDEESEEEEEEEESEGLSCDASEGEAGWMTDECQQWL